MYNEQFSEAMESEKINKGIGTLSEKTLHSILKNYYEPHTENHEIKIGSFVADIVGENGIFEIQTRSFDKMRKKLSAFLEVSDVTIVYPVAAVKRLCWIDTETGETTKRRKSNKKGIPQDIFYELYKIRNFLNNEHIHIKICMLEIEEFRYLNGWSKDKKRGSSRCDRIPVDLLDEIDIKNIRDYIKLIPSDIPENFTVADYSKATGLSYRYAGTALNVLNYTGVIENTGKRGRAYIYRIKDA